MRSYRQSHLSTCFSACLLLLIGASSAPAARQTRLKNSVWLQKDLELTPNDCEDLQQHMNGVRSMDQLLFSKKDISIKRAKAMTTEQLILQATKSDLYIYYMLYSKPAVGIYRASLASPTLQELLQRKDVGQGFAAAYSHLKLDPSKDPRFDKDGGCMRLYSTDTLISYPPIRRKLAGHEKEVILAMAASHKRAEEINKHFKSGKEPFGALGSTVSSAAAILAQAKPGLKVKSSKFRTDDEALKAIMAEMNRS